MITIATVVGTMDPVKKSTPLHIPNHELTLAIPNISVYKRELRKYKNLLPTHSVSTT